MTLLLHAMRGLHVAAVSFAAGAGLSGALGGAEARRAASDALRPWVAGAVVAAIATQGLLLETHAAELLDTAGLPAPGGTLAVALRSWVGRLMLAESVALGLALLLVLARMRGLWTGAVALFCLAAIALASHAGAEGGRLLTSASLIHVLLAGLWFGSLPALLVSARGDARRGGDWLRERLAAFSRLALPAMAAIVATGTGLAFWTTGGQAGLFGTRAGAVLLAKVALVAGALGCAASLRRRLASGRTLPAAIFRRPLQVETGLAFLVVLLAGVLAGLPPGAHAEIAWPWPVRLAPGTAWLTGQGSAAAIAGGLAMVAVGVGFGATAARGRRPRTLAAGGLLGVLGVATAVPAACVPAYPTSFVHMQVPYDAASVSAGAGVYDGNCATCHGRAGHGDGPAGLAMNPRPADLTAPHLGYHTHGELFWWISHGYPGSAMPGFAQRLAPEQRWSVVAYLMALSQGYQARVLQAAPVPGDPWLPAIDFPLDNQTTLADLRGLPVVLLFMNARGSAAADWLAPLGGVLGAARARVIAVVQPGIAAPRAVQSVSDSSGIIWRAWSNDRRSLAHPDFSDRDPPPALLGVLIDRFGFVRARWRSDEPEEMPGAAELAQSFAALQAEPQLADPDTHGS